MNEIWRDISGYEEIYQVSNLGNVMSLKYNGGNKKQLLKQGKTKTGYYFVCLCKNGNVKLYRVHRLVAETFIPKILNKEWINHKDGNKLNNNVNNLEWCTPSENNIHALKTKLRVGLRGKDNKNSKKIYQIDIKSNKIINIFYGIGEVERYFKKDCSSISKCCRNCKNYNTAYGYKWSYVRGEYND